MSDDQSARPVPAWREVEERRQWVRQRGGRPRWRQGWVRSSAARRRPQPTVSGAPGVPGGSGGPGGGGRQRGSRLLHQLGDYTAHAAAGLLAAAAVLCWLAFGLVTGFPNWWDNALYIVSSSITLVMVFAIQHTQARQQSATQRKLDELLRALPNADNRVIAVEEAPDAELEALADLNLADRKTPNQAAPAPPRRRQQTTVLPVPTGGKQRRGPTETHRTHRTAPHRTASASHRHRAALDWIGWRRHMTDTDPQTEAMPAGAEIEKPASDGRPTNANNHNGGAVDAAPPVHRAGSAPLSTDEQVQVQNSVINPETS